SGARAAGPARPDRRGSERRHAQLIDVAETRREETGAWRALRGTRLPGVIRRRPTLPHGDHAVPSAQEGLTAVFEMGTGVSPPPSPPEGGHNLTGLFFREQTRGSSPQAENSWSSRTAI